jgi:hypothetical protein
MRGPNPPKVKLTSVLNLTMAHFQPPDMGPEPWLANHHIGPIELTTVGQDTPQIWVNRQLFPRCEGSLINDLLPVTVSQLGARAL